MLRSHATELRDLHVHVLLDLEIFSQLERESEYGATERTVVDELQALTRRTTVAPFSSAISLLLDLKELKPDVVFNLTDWACGDRRGDASIAALLELSGIPYTGCNAWTLTLCRDKALSKLVAAQAGVACPRFYTVGRAPRLRSGATVPLPLIVKPRFGDASEGIGAAAVCRTRKAARARCRFIVEHYGDAIVEEFVSGREVSVSYLDGKVFPARELVWPARREFRIFSERLKHSRRVKIRAQLAIRALAAHRPTVQNVKDQSRKLFQAFGVKGYGRVDAILVKSQYWFLEMNPNPGLDLSASGLRPWGCLSSREVVARLVLAGFREHPRADYLCS